MLTTTDIGNALERAARTIAVLIAATMAAGFITRQTLTGLATLARNLTTHPLRTLIDLVPTVPAPAPEPSLVSLLNATILTDEQMAGEIASAKRKRPAAKATSPRVRRKPAAATKVAVGA
jgi:hypothetical protein